MSNVLSIKTTLDKGPTPPKLLALSVSGKERLSRLPEYTVEVVGNESLLTGREDISVRALVGTLVDITLNELGAKRYISGHVIQAVRGERHGRYDAYTLVLRPWLWFATRGKNSRVFQKKTVEQIVTEVLKPYEGKSEWKLASKALPELEYCVQYEESDFDFVSRLFEDHGIYYFFTHDEGAHTLVLIDDMAGHYPQLPKTAKTLAWSNKFDGEDRMTGWQSLEEARPANAVVRDYDYLASATEIEASASGAPNVASGKIGEIYEFPAKAVLNQIEEKASPSSKAAQAAATRLIEAAQSMRMLHFGESNANHLACGAIFKLEDAPLPSDNTEYLVVACDFHAEYGDHEAIEDLKSITSKRDGFVGRVEALNAKRGLFRPQRSTPRPRMYGPQVATVVGAKSNEIETDAHGRIKIQFPWDREGKKDANSSCWVRVAMPWAGKKMGLWMLPRIGHEVVVSFIGGDPDRPLVTGSVHNDANPPPYELPAHADVATWISHSTKGGKADAHNELRFCDTVDKEHVWFQAQKDCYRHVKGDTFDHLEMNETKKVKLTRKEVIGDSWFVNVKNDVMHELGKDQHTKVAGDIFTTGGATWQINLKGDYGLKVGAEAGIDVAGKTALKSVGDINVQSDGKINLKSTGNLVGDATGKVSLKSAADVLLEGLNIKAKGSTEIVLEASMGIKIVCGSSVITLGPAGVTIDGPLVKVNCGGGGGSAGAAEAADDAMPKKVEDAKFQEELQPEKAEDYDKLLADPLVPSQEKKGAGGGGMDVAVPDPEAAAKAAKAAAAEAEAAAMNASGGLLAKAKRAAVIAAVGAVAMAGVVGGGKAADKIQEELDDPDNEFGKGLDKVQDIIEDATAQGNAIEAPIEAAFDVAHEWVKEDAVDWAGEQADKAADAATDATDQAARKLDDV